MRIQERFSVSETLEAVWDFLDQPEGVGGCMPGVESLTVLDPDHIEVVIQQSVGPMRATFAAEVTVLERIPKESIRFRAAGKSIRGAAGNIHAETTVSLISDGEQTLVSVDGDLILAGVLGSVGQKVVGKQAAKVAAQFADNLRKALAGEDAGTVAVADEASSAVDVQVSPRRVAAAPSADPWPKVSAAISALSLAVSVAVLWKTRKVAR